MNLIYINYVLSFYHPLITTLVLLLRNGYDVSMYATKCCTNCLIPCHFDALRVLFPLFLSVKMHFFYISYCCLLKMC